MRENDPSRWQELKRTIILIAVIALSFLPSLFNGFIYWDDDTHLLENALARSKHESIWLAIFQTPINRTYIPLTILTFNLEHRLFGLNPFFYHLDNLLLHILVSVLIYRFIGKMGFHKNVAFLAALLFGVHPMHVESVAWVTARKDVLYSLFYILALDRYWMYLSDGKKRNHLLSLIYALLSILAKPMALSLPLILLLLDWYKNNKLKVKSLVAVIPFWAVIIPIAWLTYSINRTPMANPPAESILICIWSFAFYIKKFLFPFELIPLYVLPHPVSLSNIQYSLAVLITGGFTGLIFYFRKKRLVIFAALYFFLSIFFLLRISDVSQNLGPSIVADRFMYLPSLGFCLLFADAIIRSKQKWAKGVAIAIILLCALKTADQCRVWHDDMTFWNHVIDHKQEAYQAYNGRAVAHVKRHENNLALQDFHKALALHPNYPRAYYNMGKLFSSVGDQERALAGFNQAISLNPNNHKYFLERGIAHSKRNELEEAIVDFNKASKLSPNDAGVYNNRGLAYKKMGNFEAALNDYTKALELTPESMYVHYNRSFLWEALGKYKEALNDFKKSQALGFPKDVQRLQLLESLAK